MITNLLACITTILVTNVSENIQQPHNDYLLTPNLNAVMNWPVEPPTKRVTTEVYEQRILTIEAEGITFTNILASVRKLRKEETYFQVIPPPHWLIQPDRTYVDTNPPMALYWTNGIGTTNQLVWGMISTNVLIFTNTTPKYPAFPPPSSPEPK
jgi:hypothetical protein